MTARTISAQAPAAVSPVVATGLPRIQAGGWQDEVFLVRTGESGSARKVEVTASGTAGGSSRYGRTGAASREMRFPALSRHFKNTVQPACADARSLVRPCGAIASGIMKGGRN